MIFIAALESKGEVDFHVCTLGINVCIKKNVVNISKGETYKTPSSFHAIAIGDRAIFRYWADWSYCLVEHSYYTRPSKDGGADLKVFRFSPLVATFKCSVFPVVRKEDYDGVLEDISMWVDKAGL